MKGVLLNMNFKKVLLPFFAGALALSLAACSGDDKEKDKDQEGATDDQAAIEEMQKKLDKQKIDEDKIVAVVNDEEVSGETYNIVLENLQMQVLQSGQDPTSEEMLKYLQTETLNTLVDEALLLQQAKNKDIEVTEEELEEVLNNPSVNPDIPEETIIESIIFRKYLDDIAPIEDVSDEEIQAYYEELTTQSEGEAEIPSLEELSENIKQIIAQQEQNQKITAHLEDLKKDAKIELKI